MAEPIRIELDGALAGRHVLVDPDALTMGALEDLESTSARVMLDALAGAIVGGDLAAGHDRPGLRRLRPDEFAYLARGVLGAARLPKARPTSS